MAQASSSFPPTVDPPFDLTLVVEDKKLYVHRIFLMMHSSVFRKVLTAQRDLKVLPLTGKKFSLVVELLHQIYPGDAVSRIKDETLLELLELAQEYDVPQVFHNCNLYITQRLDSKIKPLSTDHVLFYLGIVEDYTLLSQVRGALVDLASRVPVADLKRRDLYKSVPPTAMTDVLQRRIERFEADPDVAQCLKRKNLM